MNFPGSGEIFANNPQTNTFLEAWFHIQGDEEACVGSWRDMMPCVNKRVLRKFIKIKLVGTV